MPSFIFLGTGTSSGVPQVGCKCNVCMSRDQRDCRLRTSGLYLSDSGTRILLDCGPDFRQQMMKIPFAPIDAVLLTHEHYDHVGGLDDLRPFTALRPINVFADPYCSRHLRERLPYCFAKRKYPGVPQIILNEVTPQSLFKIEELDVAPFQVIHGELPILGYRINDFAYITDMSKITPEEMQKVKGVKILVINALRTYKHHSHQTLSEALQVIDLISPQDSYLVHMSHQIGLHKDVQRVLPPHVHLAYDGLSIKW